MIKREIKFRAWDTINNTFCDVPINLINYQHDESLNSIFNDDSFIFQQFTGLKDKNGKEIYEGDIVKFTLETEQIGDVRWNGRYYVIYVRSLGPTPEFYPAPEVSEIVGNIFENPEIIK